MMEQCGVCDDKQQTCRRLRKHFGAHGNQHYRWENEGGTSELRCATGTLGGTSHYPPCFQPLNHRDVCDALLPVRLVSDL